MHNTHIKKTAISLLSVTIAGLAHAQSNVTIYGAVDVGYAKSTETSVNMRENYNNRLGFMGTEDLGNGLKATFQLEQRFNLFNGSRANTKAFEGASNVGLQGDFGQVRFGRVNELSTETYRVIDPFQQYGVGGMFTTILRGDNGNGLISNTVRYDSKNLNGFQLGATYTVKPNSTNWFFSTIEASSGYAFTFPGPTGDESYANVGYALSGTYTNGPLYLVANYNVAANTNNSYNWNLGAAYAFGPAKVSIGYEKTKDKFLSSLGSTNPELEGKKWLAGLSYKIGSGVINASYNRRSFSYGSGSDKKLALGYTHNLSKRTSLYVETSRTNYGSELGAEVDMLKSYTSGVIRPADEHMNAVAIGMTHKF